MLPENALPYTGRKLSQVSFPLGGIGTGCIGLGGDGRLVDWEIYNKPNKRSRNGWSHFAVKAEDEAGRLLDARVLNGPLAPPYNGDITPQLFDGFGFGPAIGSMAGFPHFAAASFRAAFPFAEIEFNHPAFPGAVSLRAFNPFIPGNDLDSGIPAALFTIRLRNTTAAPIRYTVCGALSNPLPAQNIHHLIEQDGVRALHLGTSAFGDDPANFHLGDLTLATDAAETSFQRYNYHGGWFDALEVYWHDLCAPGAFKDRNYDQPGANNTGLLAAHRTLAPGECAEVRFVIAWNFPNMENYWNKAAGEKAAELGVPNHWRNHYATRFLNSQHAAAYALRGWAQLEAESLRFCQALFGSTLPTEVLDAVSANISILKTPTVLRLEDGSFYAFEGCHADAGCCEGSCTHVWNYSQALAFLFPALERSMRDLNFDHNQTQAGGMRFRLALPLALDADTFAPFRACIDGQYGDVLKTYRDWKLCGDDAWLRTHWTAVKAAVEFAWSPANPDLWDPDKSGVLTGRQHHTLDMEFFSPSAWLNGFYLGALKAAAEMAEALGEPATAAEYRAIFARGKAWTDAHLFNGEYYIQQIDLNDRSLLSRFTGGEAIGYGTSDIEAVYWSEEHGELKYQAGEGCAIDQVLAQWHADLYGLGEIFDPAQTRSALAALFRHNFVPSMREHVNPMRLFALEDESGLTMFSFPAGTRRPVIPVPYASEVMTGMEYSAAALMLRYGLIEEGLAVIRAVRDRYDGEKRNPWNEIECGSNYARAMASYSFLNIYSGFTFDLRQGLLGFDPLTAGQPFRCLWSVGGAYGSVELGSDYAEVRVLGGELALRQLRLPGYAGAALHTCSHPAAYADGCLQLDAPALLPAGAVFSVRFSR
jgi:uncharacterized protein (DUF608 family)